MPKNTDLIKTQNTRRNHPVFCNLKNENV